MASTRPYDVAIIGGGIVGLATALAVTERDPGSTLTVLEKEAHWATHQTGHNSGVIHAGIYYKPGSLKATLCRDGNRSMMAFCEEHAIPYEQCGKLIVATTATEEQALDGLMERGRANGADVRRITREEIREREPHVRGLAALHVTTTGIVEYRQVAQAMARTPAERGVDLRLETQVLALPKPRTGGPRTVDTTQGPMTANLVVNCAGLHSDRIADLAGDDLGARIVPFRGDYYELRADRRSLVRHLVYPVPDPQFPFLGVHFTRMMDGSVHAGPNAVLALRREGYGKWDFDAADARDALGYPGFRRLARRHAREGAREMWRAVSKRAFVRNLQRLVPELTADDVVPAAAGVRAQAVTVDGALVDDFWIRQGDRIVHIGNAPSPAATASLEIGRHIAARLEAAHG